MLASLFIFSACATQYSGLNWRISNAVSPKDFFAVAQDIQASNLSSSEKQELNIKLIKRGLNLLETYIKIAVSEQELPSKNDILDLIKFLSSTDIRFDKDLKDQIQNLVKQALGLVFK